VVGSLLAVVASYVRASCVSGVFERGTGHKEYNVCSWGCVEREGGGISVVPDLLAMRLVMSWEGGLNHAGKLCTCMCVGGGHEGRERMGDVLSLPPGFSQCVCLQHLRQQR